MKKFLPLALALLLALSGCREAPEPVEPDPPADAPRQVETLAAEFAPRGGDPAVELKLLSPAAEKLKAALAAEGVEVGEVRLTLGTSLAATGQAVAQGSVDLAFLPAETLLAFGGEAVPLLSAAWPVPSCDSADPADWNGRAVTWTEDFAAGRRALVLAGPSAYGRALSARAESGAPLTWEELSRARWALAGGRSGDMASLWLADRYEGRTLADLPETAACDGEEGLLAALAAEEADVAVLMADGRIDGAERWTRSPETGGWGRGGFIWDETRVLGVTEPFYGTVAAAAPGGLWAEADLSRALEAALDRLRDDRDLSGLAGAGPFAPLTAADLDPLRRLPEQAP